MTEVRIFPVKITAVALLTALEHSGVLHSNARSSSSYSKIVETLSRLSHSSHYLVCHTSEHQLNDTHTLVDLMPILRSSLALPPTDQKSIHVDGITQLHDRAGDTILSLLQAGPADFVPSTLCTRPRKAPCVLGVRQAVYRIVRGDKRRACRLLTGGMSADCFCAFVLNPRCMLACSPSSWLREACCISPKIHNAAYRRITTCY
jgi:hypothetical protein